MRNKILSVLTLLTLLTINAAPTSFATVGVEEMPDSLKKLR